MYMVLIWNKDESLVTKPVTSPVERLPAGKDLNLVRFRLGSLKVLEQDMNSLSSPPCLADSTKTSPNRCFIAINWGMACRVRMNGD